MASVEIGSADPTAQDIEKNLTMPRLGGGDIRHPEFRLLTDDSLHVPAGFLTWIMASKPTTLLPKVLLLTPP